MTVAYPAPTDAPAQTQRSTPTWRRTAFATIAIFILLGPAPGQLFGVHSMLLRE